MHRHQQLLTIFTALSVCTVFSNGPADAHFHWHAPKSQQSTTVQAKRSRTNLQVLRKGATTSGTNSQESNDPAGPVVVAPSSLIDLNTARFGRLEITLTDASFLDTTAKDLHLVAEKMDLLSGTLDSLSITTKQGAFQGFTIDEMTLSTQGQLRFDTVLLLNDKVLQFQQPAHALARVMVTQSSLNSFLNAPDVLARLSDSAKKRVPILSNLSKQDVKFGFNFLKSTILLKADNTVEMAMDSRLGLGKGGLPVTISAQTKLALQDGWVNLTETRLLTAGQQIPHGMSARIVDRINSLSKWGRYSDDVKFQFTELKVLPEDRLELQGTAEIRRLRFARSSMPAEAPANQSDVTPSNPQNNENQPPREPNL